MATLQALTTDLEGALERKDLEAVASVRRSIAQMFPDSAAGAEANYKLGLDALFRQRNMDAAADHFRAATKAKVAEWGVPARVSLGMVLLRQAKPQQAIFELRRVAAVEPPTAQSALAASLVVVALTEQGKAAEASRARQQHQRILERLQKQPPGADRAIGAFMLGMEKKFEGDRPGALQALKAALAQPELPDEYRGQAERALSDLSIA